ncbi:hypothetical protein Pfo_008513 [Paulownia fortunei]|nr:hypothetical protein Pfo_008513 [Paulownia fortunei]
MQLTWKLQSKPIGRNRELISHVSLLNICRFYDFLAQFVSTTKDKLAKIEREPGIWGANPVLFTPN